MSDTPISHKDLEKPEAWAKKEDVIAATDNVVKSRGEACKLILFPQVQLSLY